MLSQPGYQAIVMDTLRSILRTKSNQTVKLGQLIGYSIRDMFLEKSHLKCSGETISRPFSRKSKLSIFLDQYSEVLYSLFLLFPKLKTIEIY